MLKNLTTFEIESLAKDYNLTDGHAFRRWLAAEEAIIDRSSQLFKDNNRRLQSQIEREYVHDFMRLSRQTYDEDELA